MVTIFIQSRSLEYNSQYLDFLKESFKGYLDSSVIGWSIYLHVVGNTDLSEDLGVDGESILE